MGTIVHVEDINVKDFFFVQKYSLICFIFLKCGIFSYDKICINYVMIKMIYDAYIQNR